MLCVEHDARQRADVSNLLKRSGCSVVAVRDAWEALETFGAHHPDIALVLFDAGVQGLSGPQLVHHLNRIDACVPIVVMSGAPDADMASYHDQNIAVVLRKPLQPDDLMAVLPASLQNGRLAMDDVMDEEPPGPSFLSTDQSSLGEVRGFHTSPTLQSPPPHGPRDLIARERHEPAMTMRAAAASEATALGAAASGTADLLRAGGASVGFQWPPSAEDLDNIEVVDTAAFGSSTAFAAEMMPQALASPPAALMPLAPLTPPAAQAPLTPLTPIARTASHAADVSLPLPPPLPPTSLSLSSRDVPAMYPTPAAYVAHGGLAAAATYLAHPAHVDIADVGIADVDIADVAKDSASAARADRHDRSRRAWLRPLRSRRFLATAAATACGVGVTTYFEARGAAPPLLSDRPFALVSMAPLAAAPNSRVPEPDGEREADAPRSSEWTPQAQPTAAPRRSSAARAATMPGSRRLVRPPMKGRVVRRATEPLADVDRVHASPARTTGSPDTISVRLTSCASCDEEAELSGRTTAGAAVAEPSPPLTRLASFFKKTPRAVAKPFKTAWRALRGRQETSSALRAN